MWLIIAKTVGMRETNSSQGTETEREREREEVIAGKKQKKERDGRRKTDPVWEFISFRISTFSSFKHVKCKEEVPNKFYQGKQTQQITPLKLHE